MKAKLNLYLAAEGCERLAKSGVMSYWHWHVLPRVVAVIENGEWVPTNIGTLPEGCKLIGVVDVDLPGHEEATQAAVDGIKAELARKRGEWMKEEVEIQRRMNELLAITLEGGDK